jgi:hypothetical protein
MSFQRQFRANIARRRSLAIDGYKSLADIGFDGDFVSPLQISAGSAVGPVLVAYNWFDAPSAIKQLPVLRQFGYMPGIPFNRVMDRAFELAGLARNDVYMTQAFHLLPSMRSERIPRWAVDISVDQVTRHEVVGRRVIALGVDAAASCKRHGIKCIEVFHPSARGLAYEDRATAIAAALLG